MYTKLDFTKLLHWSKTNKDKDLLKATQLPAESGESWFADNFAGSYKLEPFKSCTGAIWSRSNIVWSDKKVSGAFAGAKNYSNGRSRKGLCRKTLNLWYKTKIFLKTLFEKIKMYSLQQFRGALGTKLRDHMGIVPNFPIFTKTKLIWTRGSQKEEVDLPFRKGSQIVP